MSFLHLANTLHSIHAKHVNNLAYRKFKALDVPDQALPTPAEEANTVKLAETLDRAVNMQGNLADLYTKLDTPTVFRDLQPAPLTLQDIQVKLGPGNTGNKLKLIADAKSVTQFEENYKEYLTEHYAWLNEPPQLKIRPKVRPKWSPPEYPYHKYFLPSFQDMLKSLLAEKADRDMHGNVAWNMDRRDNHLAIVRRIFEGNIYSSDAITDLIVEPVRVSCFERDKRKGGNLPSQKDVWDKLVADAKAGGEPIPTNPKAAYEMVYGIARGCNLFNITLGIYLLTGEKNNKSWAPIDALKGAPGDVLDPAAGWGDRLGAAFITGATSYRGWDTNDKLQPVYNELGKEYSSHGLNLDWKIECAPFETADLKGAMFDTVITSPPFFDKEIYEGETTSTTVHRGKAGWIKNYYHPMLKKAGGALRPGGRFIAYISDGWMETSAKEILEGQLKMEYVGRVGYVQELKDAKPDAGRVRNAFIWRVPKADAAPLTGSTANATSLENYYGPSVYLRLMRAMNGTSKAAGGYNVTDLSDLVKFHKPDLMPKFANRENLLAILREIREDIRLGPPVPETPRIVVETETSSSIPEPEPSVKSTSGVTLVPLHRDHFTALRKIQTDAKLRMGEGIAGRGIAPTLEKALTLGYNTVFNNNEIIGFIGKYEIPGRDQDARFVRNLTKSTALKPGWLLKDAPLPEGSTHVLHGFINTDDSALIAKAFNQASFKHTLYDVDDGKNSKVMTSLGFSDTVTDSFIPTWKWHWYELSKDSGKPSDRVLGRVTTEKSEFRLEKLDYRHRAEVERLTSDVATMRTVGTGRPWDKRKLDDLFKYAKQDKDSLKTQYISYVIMYDGRVRGMLQFHPSSASNDLAINNVIKTDARLYLTIFIHKDYQRRGLAERALRQAIDELRASRGNLIAFGAHIASTNTASLALHKKLNFKIEAVERIGLREFLALSLPPPLPDAAKGTFILNLENLMLPEHLAALNSRGLREITLDDAVKLGGCEHVIMHGEMEGDKRLWRIATLLRSRVDAEVMTNKAWLSDVMKNVSINDSQLVLAKSDRLKGFVSVPVFNDERGNPMAWIWRPEEDNTKGPVGWGGKGIMIGSGTDDLKALLAENKFKLTGLLTRFEESPMLLPWKLREFPYHPTYNATSANLDVVEMRKFHLRVYVLIVTDIHGKRMGLYKSGHLICFADKEYKENTLKDMDIHNTRLRGNNSKPFPEGWETTNGLTKDGLMGQLVELFKAVANKCMPRVKAYAESHYGYEILGCDVMVNSTGKAWIVEMNKKHGTGGNTPGTPGVPERISKNLYGGLFEYLDVPGSNSFITEVWSESEVKLPAAPKRSLEEKGAAVAIAKEPRSAIAAYHSKIKYDVLKRIKAEGVPENPRILDLACGRGGDLFKYIDTFGKGTRIYGVDIDANAIAEAKKRVIAKGARNITLAVADVSKPELNTSAWGEPYDIIVCNFAAHYFFKSRETLSSFARIINRFSKKGTIVWIIMPEGIELVRLLIQNGKRVNTKVMIENETYNLSSDVSEMRKVGGKVDYKLHGTTYFQTAEPGANIITEGTSHEYFADIDTLLEYMGITSEPPNDYRARYEVVDQSLFSRWGRHGRDLTVTQSEISFTNQSTILKRNEDQVARPMRDGKPISEAELRAYWKPAEAKYGGDIPFERTSESDKRVLANLKL